MKNFESDFIEKVLSLSPELQLLLWSIRVDDQFFEQAKQFLYAKTPIIDISKLKRISNSERLSQLLYSRIKTLEKRKINQNLLKSLKDYNFQILINSVKLSGNLEKIIKLLEKNGLNPVAIKGPVLGIIAYNDITLRSSVDLDIMIQNQEFNKIVKILVENEYSTLFSTNKKIIQYLNRTWRDINFQKGNIRLDIHQQIAKGPKFFRPDKRMFMSCKKIKLNKIHVKTFSSEDTLVIMAINCAKDGFSSLKHFRDISGIVINNPELDWERIFFTAKKRKSLKIVKISLKLSQLFCGLNLPDNISDQINTRSINRSFIFFVNRLFSNNFDLDIITWYLTVPRSLDTIFSKIRFHIWFFLYPSPHIHKAIFNIPEKIFFILPIISPFYLLYNYLSRFYKIKMKKKKTE